MSRHVVYHDYRGIPNAWCLRYNICSAWFLDIRIYQLVLQISAFSSAIIGIYKVAINKNT